MKEFTYCKNLRIPPNIVEMGYLDILFDYVCSRIFALQCRLRYAGIHLSFQVCSYNDNGDMGWVVKLQSSEKITVAAKLLHKEIKQKIKQIAKGGVKCQITTI